MADDLNARDLVEQLARAYVAALNARDIDTAAGLVSVDFVNEHTATLGESVVGREAYRHKLAEFLTEFADLQYDIEDVIVDGERVAMPYILSATWLDSVDTSATGRPFSVRGMFRFLVKDGYISHRVDYWDSADFAQQVGMST